MTIEDIIKKLANNKTFYLEICKVLKVNTGQRTIDVEPLNHEAEMFDCRLQASISPTAGFYMLPQVGSFVVVGYINKNVGVVLLQTEIDKIVAETDNTSIAIDDNYKAETKEYDLQAEKIKSQAQSIKELADSITIASKEVGVQPAVLGTNNNIVFTDILTNITSLLAGLSAFCATQVAVCSGVLLPLKPGYDALAVALGAVSAQLATIAPKLQQTLSNTVKID